MPYLAPGEAGSRIRFQNHHIAEPWSDLAEQSFAGRSPKVKTLADNLFHALVEVISAGTDLRLELDDGNDDSLICHNDMRYNQNLWMHHLTEGATYLPL